MGAGFVLTEFSYSLLGLHEDKIDEEIPQNDSKSYPYDDGSFQEIFIIRSVNIE